MTDELKPRLHLWDVAKVQGIQIKNGVKEMKESEDRMQKEVGNVLKNIILTAKKCDKWISENPKKIAMIEKKIFKAMKKAIGK